jgi:hypothetical protein
MNEQVTDLCDKILEVTTQDDGGPVAEPDVVFSALQRAFMFWMARYCLACRKNIARKLRADIPAMVNSASQFAAEIAAKTGKGQTCH